MEKIFFDSWESILRTLIIGVFAYAGLVLLLRVSGTRTLSQLNAFDFIVTVALGSTLATVILNKDVALFDGLLAFGILILLQWAISALSVRFKNIRTIIKSEPFLLLYKGKLLRKALKDHQITEDEVLQIVRAKGMDDINSVDAIVLETNGQFSVIPKLKDDKETVLENVERSNE